MMLFSLIVPTRGRPEAFRRLLDSICDTAQNPASIEVVAVIDEDDRESHAFAHAGLRIERVLLPPGQTMGILNLAGYRVARGRYLMLLNDDVVVRTSGWDTQLQRVFERHPDGIVLAHVNDLIFRDSLCTFPFLAREFCELAGGICPREYRRYRIDDHIHHIFDLIHLLGHTRQIFLPEVIFEHCNFIESPSGVRKYVPNPAIQEMDNRDFEALLEERRRVALACVERIEGRAHIEERAMRVRLLEAFPDTIALRRREHARWWQAADPAAGGKVTVAVIAENAHAALGCLKTLRTASATVPTVVVPRRNDALALCRSDYLVLLDAAVRVAPGWLEEAFSVLASGAGIAVAEHALLIDVPRCGHLRFDEARQDAVPAYLEQVRAADVGVAHWTGRRGRVIRMAAQPRRPGLSQAVAFPRPAFRTRAVFWLWGTLATLAARWPVFAKLGGEISAALFDPAWYLARYPAVAASGANPLLHYLEHGGFEGLDPNPHFDSRWYLATNPDVAASGLNPLVHFVRYGAREGRNPSRLKLGPAAEP
jgi:hypothetical protein